MGTEQRSWMCANPLVMTPDGGVGEMMIRLHSTKKHENKNDRVRGGGEEKPLDTAGQLMHPCAYFWDYHRPTLN